MDIKPLSQSLFLALSQRDQHTGEHCERVCSLSVELGRKVGLSAGELSLLHQAAALHDLGKIGIPDLILLKPGPLDDEEWQIMATHAERGANIIAAAGIHQAGHIATVVRHHHEHFDGTGYPSHLSGHEIPLLSRMIAITDSYDALTMPRSYRPAMPHAQAMQVMQDERGYKHDPELLDRFVVLINDGIQGTFQ